MERVLFATSEVLPLVKTGGLADVSASLATALRRRDRDIRVVLPAYPAAMAAAGPLQPVAALRPPGSLTPVYLLAGILPGTDVPLWLVDSPSHFRRPGGPYGDEEGRDWPDNAARFALLGRVITAIALDRAGLLWRPDVVHCNDWQTALAPALLAREKSRPATVFTIHNLSYQGLFPWGTFAALELPPELWSATAMEFFGKFSFIKGGLVFADMLSTVSPSYAREIRTPALGFGLEGLLEARAERLVGILNGVDYERWDPRCDPRIAYPYGRDDVAGKGDNKAALQERLGLPTRADVPLMGLVGRMVEQKGFDLVLAALPDLLQGDALQVAVLGSGDKPLERAVKDLVSRYPAALAGHIGYDEDLAHLIEAGADLFLMPSRFEPCGLNQIYSLRYGTLPVVRRTGGLADTVVDVSPQSLAAGTATGFTFEEATATALIAAVRRALALFAQPKVWRSVMRTAMVQDYSWSKSAAAYVALYRRARGLREAARAER